MDTALLVIVLVGGVLFSGLAFVFGKYQDIVWRTKTFRKHLKKNFVILERVSKDAKTRTQRMINLDGDIFNVNNFTWVAKAGRIYRKDKESEGFRANKTNISWEEGVPIITVDEDSIKPLDFYKDDSSVKPEELGSTLSAWVMNQLAKGFAAIKSQDIWIKLIAVGVIINLLLTYATMDAVNKLQTQGIKTTSGQVTPQAGTVDKGEDTIVITQPGAT